MARPAVKERGGAGRRLGGRRSGNGCGLARRGLHAQAAERAGAGVLRGAAGPGPGGPAGQPDHPRHAHHGRGRQRNGHQVSPGGTGRGGGGGGRDACGRDAAGTGYPGACTAGVRSVWPGAGSRRLLPARPCELRAGVTPLPLSPHRFGICPPTPALTVFSRGKKTAINSRFTVCKCDLSCG